MISAKTKLCMVIGNPVQHSLSPQMHNAGYNAVGIADQFIYTAANVQIEHIADFIKGVRAMGIVGVSCTIPHKIAVMEYLDEIDQVAQKIGAVNTIVNENGVLKGYNTDWLGVVKPLEEKTSLKEKTVALLGAGGAARAVAYGITQKGATLLVFNRTAEKAKELASEFGGKGFGFEDVEKVRDVDIIFNATSVGLHPKENESPLPKELLHKEQIVFDAIYAPFETRLLTNAKEVGATVIHGTEMLLQQAVEQFRLFTGKNAAEDVMRATLLSHVVGKEQM